jgi:BirA family biotin operon repressor/biotin-[acetyl-CoA-carboxylase] ligase
LTQTQRKFVDYLQELIPDGEQWSITAVPSWLNAAAWDAVVLVDHATASQYDALLAALRRRGASPGSVVALALSGDGFHGNRDRSWRAEQGNLHLCCQVPVDLDLASCMAAVPAVAAVSVCEAIAALCPGASPVIKWINDVLLGDGKVAGVLASAQSRGARLLTLTYGIGLNVQVSPVVPPTLFVPAVTSLADAGHRVPLGAAAGAVLDRLQHHLASLAGPTGGRGTVAAYRARCDDIGRQVAVYAEGLPDTADASALPAPLARGRVTGLDDALQLLVEGCAGPLSGGRLCYDDRRG